MELRGLRSGHGVRKCLHSKDGLVCRWPGKRASGLAPSQPGPSTPTTTTKPQARGDWGVLKPHFHKVHLLLHTSHISMPPLQHQCCPSSLVRPSPSCSASASASANIRPSDKMAKKRKSENVVLDEVERTLYTSFCTAANSISQLYTQAQNQQKLSFQAGERHAVEKLYYWLLREHQNGSNITVAQIIHNLQSELEGGNGEEMTMSPGHQLQQHVPAQQQLSVVGTVGTSGRTTALSAPLDQGKIPVFQGALSSPNRRCFPAFAMSPGGYGVPNSTVQPARRGSLSSEHPGGDLREGQLDSAPLEDPSATGFGFQPPLQQHQHQHHSQHVRDGVHSCNENDSSMDMHADGVAEDYYR